MAARYREVCCRYSTTRPFHAATRARLLPEGAAFLPESHRAVVTIGGEYSTSRSPETPALASALPLKEQSPHTSPETRQNHAPSHETSSRSTSRGTAKT